MIDIANHVRIFDPIPTDDIVSKRALAVRDLGAKFSRLRNINSLLAATNNVSTAFWNDGQLPNELASMVEEAIRVHSPAFLKDGEELQMRTIALLGMSHALKTSRTAASLGASEIIATSLWLGLSFQPPCTEPKLEALRTEVLIEAREFVLANANQWRLRTEVPDVTLEPFSADQADASTKISSAMRQPIDALRKNAQRDREELDFLWWALSDYSEILKSPLSTLSPAAAALTAGLEAANRLTHLPCEAHKYVVFRHVREDALMTLHNLAVDFAPYIGKIDHLTTHRIVDEYPAIFGLLNGLAPEPKACIGADQERSLTEWAGRALLEAGFLKLAIEQIGEKA